MHPNCTTMVHLEWIKYLHCPVGSLLAGDIHPAEDIPAVVHLDIHIHPLHTDSSCF